MMPAEATRTSDPAADPALVPHWLILGSVTLVGRPEYVRAARQFVTRTIGDDHPKADAAVLLTSELVTNAVTHSRSRLPGGTIELVVATKSSGLLISVTDNGSDSQVPAIGVRPGGENGHGLLLVEKLADVWGYLQDSARTVVWFRLCTHQAPRRGTDAGLLPGCLPPRRSLACGVRDSFHITRPEPGPAVGVHPVA
jgi:anti-sigma regulatory factor (Ser/Thr protein kinase)